MMMVKVLATVLLLLALVFHGPCVSAETHHHVVGGEKDLDVASWLSGRVFRVGDKILFNFGNEEKIVELNGPDEFKTCAVSNPIRMYTDDHVVLDREGTRYFASANLQNCKNGLRIPVSVQSADQFDPIEPLDPPPSKFAGALRAFAGFPTTTASNSKQAVARRKFEGVYIRALCWTAVVLCRWALNLSFLLLLSPL